MADPILVDAAWQTATYGLIGVVITLCGVIVKMVHWWIFKERPKVAVKFEENDTALTDLVYKNQKAFSAHGLILMAIKSSNEMRYL